MHRQKNRLEVGSEDGNLHINILLQSLPHVPTIILIPNCGRPPEQHTEEHTKNTPALPTGSAHDHSKHQLGCKTRSDGIYPPFEEDAKDSKELKRKHAKKQKSISVWMEKGCM